MIQRLYTARDWHDIETLIVTKGNDHTISLDSWTTSFDSPEEEHLERLNFRARRNTPIDLGFELVD